MTEQSGAGIEALDIVKRYGGEGDSAVTVLDGVSLTVRHGESVAVVGPSGSGKSTLLNILGTLERADAGTVRLNGVAIENLDERRLAPIRACDIGFVFQLHHLLPQCTVLENVLIPALALPRHRRAAVRERGERLLERVGLTGKLRSRPGELSGGERQRVAVVRALVNGPGILLADEPTGALDEAGAAALVDLLVELTQEERLALVMVTHAQSLAARLQRVLRLAHGLLVPVAQDARA
jgi:lipoprotein-releasing system ATP-binding protein